MNLRQEHLDEIETRYVARRDTPSDFNEHMPILRCYAERVDHVTEFGVGWSSWALLRALPKCLRYYDIGDDLRQVGMRRLVELGRLVGIDTDYIIGDTLEVLIDPTDLLFIDTTHTYEHLTAELNRHAKNVTKYILMHDTDVPAAGLLRAASDFVARDGGWKVKDHLKNSHGLTILERK